MIIETDTNKKKGTRELFISKHYNYRDLVYVYVVVVKHSLIK